MTEYLWIVTDNYMSLDPNAGRVVQDNTSDGIYNATWVIPSSQYEKLDKKEQKKFLNLQFFFQEGITDPTGRQVYLMEVEDDIADIFAYQGNRDLDFTFEVGPGNKYLNYYGVPEDLTTWKEMRDSVESQREAGEGPTGTFTVEKFITDKSELQKMWDGLKKSQQQMKEPKAAETNFGAEGLEYKFALIAKYPDSDVQEATWEKIPEDMEAIEKTHVTLVGGKALKEFKKELKEGTKEVIAGLPEPPTPELGRTGVAKRTMGDGEVRETFFVEVTNQEDFQDYADQLCEALGISNPEPERFFHISIANNHGGNPFKSVGDITESDLHGFAAENVPLGYMATLAADGETIVVQPDAWLAETFSLAAPSEAYAYAYGEGYRQGREGSVFHPVLSTKDRDLFRDTFRHKAKAESFGAENDDSTTCEDCGVIIGYDEAFDWEGLDRCEECYDYWMMKDRQNYSGDETDCISCGYSISPNDVRFELVKGLCPDCEDSKDAESFNAPYAGAGALMPIKTNNLSAETKKGRKLPKRGVAKWGNDYWPNGVTYQEWKYRHPASVRVYAEAWGVPLKSLSPKQKDWLKWRYMEDVDSQTALAALIDEFQLSAPNR